MCIYKYIQDKTPQNIALYKLVLVLVKYGKHYHTTLQCISGVKGNGEIIRGIEENRIHSAYSWEGDREELK